MSYKSIGTSLAACSICHLLWNVDLKEDDSGAGMHAFRRDGSTHYAPPPCAHFAHNTFPHSIDQRISFTPISAQWNAKN